MIKTSYSTTFEELDKRIKEECGRNLYAFDIHERDAYTGELTLHDKAELEGPVTCLWVSEDGYDVAVMDDEGNVVTEEEAEDFADAMRIYERQSGENTGRLVY